MKKYAGIVVNNESDMVDKVFTYKIPEKLFNKVSVGHRVKVSFGKGNKEIDGFVIELIEFASEKIKFKEIIEICDEFTLFEEWDISLIYEIKERYLCSLLDAIRALIPAGALSGLKAKTIKKLYLGKNIEGKFLKEPYISIQRLVNENPGVYSTATISKEFQLSISSIKTLISKGNLIESERAVSRVDNREFIDYKKVELNANQKSAFDEIINSKENMFLLHGVTGSGKTEIYLNLVDNYLKENKDSIILVPEISLTPQMVERFKGRFGNKITVFHSRLSQGEKFDEWMRVKNGDVKIAIGARSAIFLPFKQLSLIIIDEEHENSYKSEMDPKYNAIEIGEIKSKSHNAKLVLGTATPNLTTYYKAKNNMYQLISITQRVDGAKLPTTEVIDMREELRAENRSIFSRRLREEIEATLSRREQVILFLNRRGFSTFVSCRSCGFVFKCKNCDISLTYHSGKNSLSCHYCGSVYEISKTCPKCSSKYVKYFGVGTEKVEEEVRRHFPKARTLRMDFDTTRDKSSYESIYKTFKEGDADILIGTQMIAKGLDFKNVTLVGVMAADITLNLPDFMAAERTFQLITQVSGRAGRGTLDGKVVIQTYNPDHYSIKHAANQDYIGFYNEEINLRDIMNYPPFSKIMNIIFTSKNENVLIKGSEIASQGLKNCSFVEKLSVLGPTPCSISKIKEQFRWQLIIKGHLQKEEALEIKKIIYNVVKKFSSDIKIGVDFQ